MQEIDGRALRVVVADDSAVMRGILRTLFATHAENYESELPPMEICGEAQDGVECLELVRQLQPDVLLLDLEMPRMHGLDVLDRLREESPELPVVMCSAYTELGARLTVDALARGASDYVMKPSVQSDFTRALRVLSEQLLPKIAGLAERPKRKYSEIAGSAELKGTPRLRADVGRSSARTDVVVIGISTGGPSALETMLSTLPANFPVPLLIAQHMPKLFTGALAARLDCCCALQVKEAYDGALPTPGTVWVAQGDTHMTVESTSLASIPGRGRVRIRLHDAPPMNYCRPSADLLFHSAAEVYGSGTLALVMTGMGSDGADGARGVHQAGGMVWAQDEASSAVWGMPGRVMQTGIVDALMPLTSIGEQLTRQGWVRRRGPVSVEHRLVLTATEAEAREATYG